MRLNASHLSAEDLARRAAQAREGAPDLPLVVDLQGAKMRVGDIVERPLAVGARVRFAAEKAGPEDVPLPHPELFAAAEVGATLGFDDGRLRFAVRARGEEWLEAEALVAGVLRPRKGVNLLEHPVRLSGLTPGDAARLEAVRGLSGLQVAWSFMLDGREADWVRARLPGTPVVAKVERREAVHAIAEIDARVDALWVCRGDLGEQPGPGALARFVGSLSPADLPCPVLMAGQALFPSEAALTSHPRFSREYRWLRTFDASSYSYHLMLYERAGRAPRPAVHAVNPSEGGVLGHELDAEDVEGP